MPRLPDDEMPAALRAFDFHGVVLDWRNKANAEGDCPFCGAEGKLSVDAKEGLWNCFVCGERGNPLTFLRRLWDESDKATNGQSDELARERGLLFPETCTAWGAAVSVTTGDWLLPGRSPDGKLATLYAWRGSPKRLLLATPGFGHGLFMAGGFDPIKDEVMVCEGPWDAMALWEALRIAKRGADGLERTGSEASSLGANVNVIAAPGANSWQEGWCKLLAGKKVCLLFDNDHERPHPKTGEVIVGAGWAGMKRTAGLMASHRDRPAEVSCLRWSARGTFDPELPSGFDVRDALAGATADEKVAALGSLLAKIGPAPDDWLPGGGAEPRRKGSTRIEPLPCSSWRELLNAARLALHWRDDLTAVFATMLAVACSTDRRDDQLFLQVIADAGSAKTRLCDAMLISDSCYALENMTGFTSGWKSGQGEDYSLLTRINHKTLITPEADVLMSSPIFGLLMSQMRRLFDGKTAQDYKTLKEQRRYEGLRTPLIMAGTPAMLDHDQSRLGDRFLKVHMGRASADQEDDILMMAGHASNESVRYEANGDAASCLDERMLRFYRLTGGYVDHLRTNAGELIAALAHHDDPEPLVRRCAVLAKFCAALRARPNAEAKDHKEKHDTVELPSRLTKQLVRLANCLAAVTQRPRADDPFVLGIAKRVAMDTCRGRTFEIARRLAGAKPAEGISSDGLANLTGHQPAAERNLLLFLHRIGVAEHFRFRQGMSERHRWRLTRKFSAVWSEVMGT